MEAPAHPRHLLFVVSNAAVPPQDGKQHQAFYLMRAMGKRGFAISLFGLNQPASPFDPEWLACEIPQLVEAGSFERRGSYAKQSAVLFLKALLRPILPAAWCPDDLLTAIHRLHADHPIDGIYLEGVILVPYLKPLSSWPLLISLIDSYSLRCVRQADLAQGIWQRTERWVASWYARRLECAAFAEADAVHVCGIQDFRHLSTHLHPRNLLQIPVCAPELPEPTEEEPSAPRDLLVWAEIRHPHLLQGVLWFLNEVLPLIQTKNPGVRLSIWGGEKGRAGLPESWRAAPSIQYIGWADDPLAILRRHAVVILPDPTGTGLKNRAISAMSAGRPVVGTPAALESIPFTDNQDACCADNAVDFAQKCETLLQNKTLRDDIGQRSRALIGNSFAPAVVMSRWEEAFRQMIQRPRLARH